MDSLKIYNADGSVDVRIPEEVIAIIAGLAATEIEGVHSMAGGITNEIVSKLGRKNLSAGVSIRREDNALALVLEIVTDLGYNIQEVCEKVQQKVKNAVETMTGQSVKAVHVHVVNLNIDNQ